MTRHLALVSCLLVAAAAGCGGTTRYIAAPQNGDTTRARACFDACRFAADTNSEACLSSCPDVRTDGVASCPPDATPCVIRQDGGMSVNTLLTIGALVVLGGIVLVVAASPH